MSATVAPWNLEPISVTIAEATRLLGFKDSKTVYNLIYQGKIKARKVGDNARFFAHFRIPGLT